ncbi:fumarylacetoacetate hydrolase family protein [Mycolicibacterium sphagni]|uniref:fumarylacetoacetate hydrolase family protein n=1 Tax=Mycolicibacterium sphagni TaxID=1786 RepID=UPI0021F276D5|nr:fumarylacetoacetate hydrolase family protein [Mycolicibacterium sphagni]MCV7174210.1 fumarylacetoacetate hydrolase family protein [Mycolicibacterium sphagni]
MRIAQHAGRLTLLVEGGGIDVEQATGGRFGGSRGDATLDALERFEEFRDAVAGLTTPTLAIDPSSLGAPVALPRQVFAVALNYRDHATESGIPEEGLPTAPAIFTKFPTSTTGPAATVELPSNTVDYEVEMVIVIGRRAERLTEDVAWRHVAGLMVGQDLSERRVQLAPPVAQFSLGKSFRGFSPTGPAIVTLDEIPDPDALDISCRIGEEILQSGNTKDLIFSVPELIARLSRICPLLPGDTIWTGTPAGVGLGRTPARFLVAGETLTSSIGSLGEIHTTFVNAADYTVHEEA